MKIRSKIVLVVLPLILTPLVFTGFIATFSARNGITSIATSFLRFKSEELTNYANSQWNLLVDNSLSDDSEFVQATQAAVQSFAKQMIRSETETILAIDETGQITMATSDIELSGDETLAIQNLAASGEYGWQVVTMADTSYAAEISALSDYGWTVVVGEEEEFFYSAINLIIRRTAIIVAIALSVSITMLLLFSGVLTRPLANVVTAMKSIIVSNDLSKRVEVLYKDETGELGNTFNVMTGELERAYKQIKEYAIEAAFAQYKEQKIRNIFQKYVPNNVIEEFFANPEKALVGEDRIMSILFSDVRQFTTIAEKMLPDQVVESLNQYFGRMVEVIEGRKGIVDKYMGDAIMAFFGAPERHGDEAYRALMSGFDMLNELEEFNKWMAERDRPPFKIGVGISYGYTTIGNIGCERKLDYTVIGDMVNIGSRLEGLTKHFGIPLLVSDSVARSVKDQVPCRLVGKIVVKGLTRDIGVYEPRQDLTAREQKGWDTYAIALDAYYDRKFDEASSALTAAKQFMPDDKLTDQFLERCQQYIGFPPPEGWTGVEIMDEK